MEISKQVCSIEQAKRLKELGVRQTSAFLWMLVADIVRPNPEEDILNWEVGTHRPLKSIREERPAYSVAELGMMLIDQKDEWFVNSCYNSYKGCWGMEYFIINTDTYSVNFGKPKQQGIDIREPTEAQARAAMLIYLLENKLISVDDMSKAA